MVFISVLTPSVEHPALQSADYQSYCETLFTTSKIQLCKLVPLEPGDVTDEIVIKFDSGLSLKSIEALLEDREELHLQIDQAKEALKFFSSENAKLKDQLSQNKGQRMKSLEEENRKLRGILQYFTHRNSLDSEKQIRQEQQETVEELRGQVKRLEEEAKRREDLKREEPKEAGIRVPKLQFPKGGLSFPGKS